MKKLIVMSIMIATLAIPMMYATRAIEPRLAIPLMQKRFVWFCIIYVLAVCYVVPRMQ